MNASSIRLLLAPAVAGILLIACGEPARPVNPSSGELPLVVPSGTPAAEPPPSAEPEPSAAPTASAKASGTPRPALTTAPLPEGCSRPPFVKSDEKEVTDTFGTSPCAKLQLGTEGDMAYFRIPENALSTGTNVTFKIDPKGKSTGVVIGKIYHLQSVIPPSGEPEKVVSAGPSFELQLPAGAKKDANLAIGQIGGGKITWKIIAPIKIDDVTNLATYLLPEIGDLYLHVTTKAVTPEK